jgi:hypothetical protein
VLKTLLLWSLVALVPLTNIRMVCVDHSGTRASAQRPDCGELCPRDAGGRAAPQETSCVLVAGWCSAVTAVAVALPAPGIFPLGGAPATLAALPPDVPVHSAPAVRPVSPPPKR